MSDLFVDIGRRMCAMLRLNTLNDSFVAGKTEERCRTMQNCYLMRDYYNYYYYTTNKQKMQTDLPVNEAQTYSVLW